MRNNLSDAAPHNDALARRWPGRAPWEEVWFVELSLARHRSVWLRYTITDGPDPQCALWAIVAGPEGVRAHRTEFPLSQLGPRHPMDLGPEGFLSASRAEGRCGPCGWSLALIDRGRRHTHVPSLIRRLGVGRHYAPAVLDLRATGTVRWGDETYTLTDTPGVLGHIHGRHNRTRAWAWAHCAHFDGHDAVFEGLSVQLGGSRARTPPLTSTVLHLGDHAYRFSRTRDLLVTRSRFAGNHWALHSRRPGVSLRGVLELDPAHTALVRYAPPGGQPSWCRNSGSARLRLTLVDRERSVRAELTSDRAAFELGTRRDPGSEPIAG